MDNHTIFFHDPSPTITNIQPLKYTKPPDDFRSLHSSDSSIFYLAVTTPHTDTYTLHGPVSSFSHLLPTITAIVSDSPSALDKLENLQYSVPDVWGRRRKIKGFETHGFRTLVVEGQYGTYTVLEVLTVQNDEVKNALPRPLYTVTRHGPLVHAFEGVGARAKLGVAKGVAATSALVGSYTERKDAQAAAKMAMEEMIKGEGMVSKIEEWGKGGEGGGVLLAVGLGVRWEVKVLHETEVLRGLRDGVDAERAGVELRF